MAPKRSLDEVNGAGRPPSGQGINDAQAQIAAAKARISALMANNTSLNQVRPPPISAAAGTSNGITARPRPPPSLNSVNASHNNATNIGRPSRPTGFDPASMQARIDEARRKAGTLSGNRIGSRPPPPIRHEEAKPSGIHPLLLNGGVNTSGKGKPFPGSPSFTKATPSADVVNPYLSSIATEDDGEGSIPRARTKRRMMQFNAPGRHIRAAEEARREAQMEELKRRIEEQSRKAGLDELTAEERALRRPQPPGIEWWDQQFLPGQDSYDAIRSMGLEKGKGKDTAGTVLLEGEGSPVDIYIQHPIPIPAPSDKIKIESRGVMLTKKEMKKMRRMRRRAEQEDKRDRIKMGLQAPDPPKVKLSNLMRVLTSEAISDPTKVEARVRREVAARKDQHEQTNLERKLTDEERKAKFEEQKQKDLSKGLFTLVFKIKHLASPSHKFKVRKNALQLGLTGMTLFGKDFALVFVEGGQKAIKSYRHLMLNRIDWQDPGRPKASDGVDNLSDIGTPATQSSTTISMNEQDELLNSINWSDNFCRILFEGPIRERRFESGFQARKCETDYDAKQALDTKRASYWDLAKRDEKANEDEYIL
ncbi:hypothetical protein L7F22_039164 [Adiantum nelumboides]|nr:hypothetical protein [Adiantum nelumboides]